MLVECTRCRETKPATEFSKCRSNKNGLFTWCRPCRALSDRAYRKTAAGRRAQRRATDKWLKNNRDLKKQRSAEQVKRKPWVAKGRRAIYREIRNGNMKPASEYTCCCGAPALDWHHEDYRRLLEVTPLCRPCHRRWHLSIVPIAPDADNMLREIIAPNQSGGDS